MKRKQERINGESGATNYQAFDANSMTMAS